MRRRRPDSRNSVEPNASDCWPAPLWAESAVAPEDWSFPVIRPVNFVFDESMNAVVFRSGRGSSCMALLLGKVAAFEIDGVDEVAKEGWSVIVAGRVEEIQRPLEVRRVEQLGVSPWATGDKPHWLLIRAETVSGRRIRRR